MAEKTFQFEVVTPGRMVVQEEVSFVVAPGGEGEFGVLAGHCPFMTTLKIGKLSYRRDGASQQMAVMGGFAEVTPTKVVVLAEAAEKAREIDVAEAKKLQNDAERQLSGSLSETDQALARKRLEWALVRQAVASAP
jgi:F-type H+-transporting ATPase subunit epsilon